MDRIRMDRICTGLIRGGRARGGLVCWNRIGRCRGGSGIRELWFRDLQL